MFGVHIYLLFLLLFIRLPQAPVLAQISNEFIINGVAVPADFPFIDHSQYDQTAPGKLFLANYFKAPYILIMENDGTPYYYKRLDNIATYITRHPDNQLSTVIREGSKVIGFEIMDMNYKAVDSVFASPYNCDVHELLITPEGHYLLIAQEERKMDLSGLIEGGDSNATVIGNHVLELDEIKNLVLEWKSWDYYDVRDARNIDLTAKRIDYVHMNSIAIDYDGHLLVSCRHLDECTKINRQTGEIIWRLGGANNQFEFINDSLQPSWQHDIRPVPGKPDQYTLFDNGNHRKEEASRVVEYAVDMENKSLTKIWEYRHPSDVFSHSMGNAQRLPNGNTLINFSNGNRPKVWEVSKTGEVVYSADFVESNSCYRSFRYEWEGVLTEPYLVVDKYPSMIRLVFNQFGDQDVSHYKVYGNEKKNRLKLIASTDNTWLEISDLGTAGWYYFGVTSVNGSGDESGFSNIDSALIHYIEDGDNMILNGDFSSGSDFWELEVRSGEASGQVSGDWYKAVITDGGEATEDVRLKQQQIPLIEGAEYRLQFEAYAEEARIIEMGLERVAFFPYLDYSRLGAMFVTEDSKTYSYSFTMNNQTDLRSMLVFDLGGGEGSVNITNVSLNRDEVSDTHTTNIPIESWPADYEENESHPIVSIYPIPASDQLIFRYNDPDISSSLIKLYNLQGAIVRSRTIPSVTAGTEYTIMVSYMPPGYYLCSIEYILHDRHDPILAKYKILIE